MIVPKPKETIFNISTGEINGVLSIIKISGPKSVVIVNKLLTKKINKKIKVKQIIYSKLIWKKTEIIDDVILLIYPKNNSFDGNENVEIICHANKIIISQIFTHLKLNGAFEAIPGEFSKNAFLNNKISLEKLNAINHLIKTKNNKNKFFFINCVTSTKISNINKIQTELKNIITNIEVTFNYPEEEKVFENTLKKIKEDVNKQILFFKNSKKFYLCNINDKNQSIVIAGKTNTGKSTLFNKIIGYSKNITSVEKQTTRDVISTLTKYQDYEFNVVDTAGFDLKYKSDIDKKAIIKTTEAIKKANLVIFLHSFTKNSKNIKTDLFWKINKLNKNSIFIVNKADRISTNLWKKNYISGRENKINYLMLKIKKFLKQNHQEDQKIVILGNEFQVKITDKIIKNYKNYLIGLNNNIYQDGLIQYLYKNYNYINTLCGINVDINVINNMFSKFCIGK